MKFENFCTTKRRISIVATAGILLVALALVAGVFTPAIQANGPMHFQVIDRDSVAYGKTYSEWSAAWWQWALSLPTNNHPLFDSSTDISVGQSGSVWFLGGKFCQSTGGPPCGYTGVVRTANVPANTALFVAVFNTEDSVLEDPANAQIAQLAAVSAGSMDLATVSMEVDGTYIHDLKDNFRVQSPAFVFTLPSPPNNVFTAIGEGTFAAGSYFPAVGDGYYVMLAPLPPGHHKIHFAGSEDGFALDVTYYLNVSH